MFSGLTLRSRYHNWWDDIDRYHRDMEEHFRKITWDDDLWRDWKSVSTRRWRDIFQNVETDGTWARVEHDNDKYRIIVDLPQFTPEEVTVRTDDKWVTVEAKHLERKDKYGYVSRQVNRRYLLPRGYNINYVKPSLSSDGILTITASKVSSWIPTSYERMVPVRRTYLPAIKS